MIHLESSEKVLTDQKLFSSGFKAQQRLIQQRIISYQVISNQVTTCIAILLRLVDLTQMQLGKRLHEKEPLIQMEMNELASKFRSKADIYSYLTESLQYYLPPLNQFNKDFLKQVLAKEKKLLKMADIRPINIPSFDELSVKSLYSGIREDPQMALYFPEPTCKTRLPDREYFFTVLNTLQPDYVSEIVQKSRSVRYTKESADKAAEVIVLSEEWYNQLKAHPFVSKCRGRTLALLKKGSKTSMGPRNRKKQEDAIPLKRFKDNQGKMQEVTKSLAMMQTQASNEETKKQESKFILPEGGLKI